MESKKCPICGESKTLDKYDTYFCKSRNKNRPQSYCKACSPKEKTKRAIDYYRLNGEKRRDYQKKRRQDPSKKQTLKQQSKEFKVRYRDNLQDCYVVDYMVKKLNLTTKQIRANPELIEVFRAKLLLTRAIKNIKNE